MKFQTESGSVYEVDEDKKQVRRLIGMADPQPRMGKDGDWRTYVSLQLILGEPALIRWDPATTPLLPGSMSGDTPATMTSTVVKIDDTVN